jgi:hypothetical protein
MWLLTCFLAFVYDRLVSGSLTGPCLAGYKAIDGPDVGLGLQRIDHVVGVSATCILYCSVQLHYILQVLL